MLAAELYLPRMEKIFSEMGVPPELTRLSLVESSFDLRAYSRVGAVGVWQFMPSTGHKLLTIDETRGIDERLSPLKSTAAAGTLLKENFKLFKNWSLAVTSYNHGLRGLMRYRRPKGERKFSEIAYLFEPCSHSSPLSWASRNYYAEFLAMLHAEKYRQLFYGEVPTVQSRPWVYRQIDKNQTALAFAMENGISLQRLHEGNPDIRNVNGRLPLNYWIATPGEADNLAGLTERYQRKKTFVARRSTHSPRHSRKV